MFLSLFVEGVVVEEVVRSGCSYVEFCTGCEGLEIVVFWLNADKSILISQSQLEHS